MAEHNTVDVSGAFEMLLEELEAYPEIALVLREAGHAFQVQFVKKGRAGAESGQCQGRVGAEPQPESRPE